MRGKITVCWSLTVKLEDSFFFFCENDNHEVFSIVCLSFNISMMLVMTIELTSSGKGKIPCFICLLIVSSHMSCALTEMAVWTSCRDTAKAWKWHLQSIYSPRISAITNRQVPASAWLGWHHVELLENPSAHTAARMKAHTSTDSYLHLRSGWVNNAAVRRSSLL